MEGLTKEKLLGLLAVAGIEHTGIWELPNRYYSYRPGEDEQTTKDNAVYRAERPWWLVRTSIGMLTIGPRKNVLSIEWEDTPVRVIVTADEVTKGDHYVHAWALVKAAEYLSAWRKAAEVSLVAARSATDLATNRR